jgi:protein-S-isoprenylcysteine O-methyltransferase Ste14
MLSRPRGNIRGHDIDSQSVRRGSSERPHGRAGGQAPPMTALKSLLRPAAWAFYAVFVLEILFMISPAALHFYAAYGPVLELLGRSPATAWLTQFFLPHVSVTGNPVLDALPSLGGALLPVGALIFAAAAGPLYWAKLGRRGAVTGGLYRFVRHPQYLGLAVMGTGTLLLWPRFLVLLSLLTLLFVYGLLARWEEARCVARFGDDYRAYQARTGMFLPRLFSLGWPRLPPAAGPRRTLAAFGVYALVLAAAAWLALVVRDYSLTRIAAIYLPNAAILSPAPLTEAELDAVYRTATGDGRVAARLAAAASAKLIVHVLPEEASFADLPMDVDSPGHHLPADFDRTRYKALFSRPRTHDPAAAGIDIVRSAYGLDTIVLARVNVAAGEVTSVETPPAHVYWGDIPTPLF